MFTMPTAVRYSQVGPDGTLSLKGLLDLLQDCCTAHSTARGLPLAHMIANHQGWLLAWWQIDLQRLPAEGEEIVVRTVPYRMGGCLGFRSFGIYTAAEEELCTADSMWVFANSQTGRPIHVPPEQLDAFPAGPRIPARSESTPIQVPEEADCRRFDPFPIHTCLMDSNHHLNNSWYPVLAQDYLPRDFAFHGLRVEYKKPVHAGDWLVPEQISCEQGYVIRLSNRDTGEADCLVRFTR